MHRTNPQRAAHPAGQRRESCPKSDEITPQGIRAHRPPLRRCEGERARLMTGRRSQTDVPIVNCAYPGAGPNLTGTICSRGRWTSIEPASRSRGERGHLNERTDHRSLRPREDL